VNITLPKRILSQIDSLAVRSGNTRSGFLAHGALKQVSSHADESEQDAAEQGNTVGRSK